MNFTAWHYEIDTLPHFSSPMKDDVGNLVTTVHIPVGVWSEAPAAFNIILEVWIGNVAPFRIGFDIGNPRGFIRSITTDGIVFERVFDRRAARWYLEMESRIPRGNQYYEAILRNVPVNEKVLYTLKIMPILQVSRTLGPYTVYTVFPQFSYADIFYMSDGQDDIDRGCVLYYGSDAGFHYLRADFVDVSTARLPFDLEIGGHRIALSDEPFAPELLPSLPLIDPFTDSVVAAIPRSPAGVLQRVRWRGIDLDVTRKTSVGRARVLFIHYCMQGLNDLFELPNKSYSPPRTYMQTTMRDENATYSSRPNSVEGIAGDGYAYTLEAHRTHGIKHLWTFNGGVLALMAHDCDADVSTIRKDIASGLLDPTIAGFGGHRLPYYQTETNRYSIQLGIDIVRNILGACNDVYYLDQRLYKQIPNVIDGLKGANIRYIVVDGSTGFYTYRRSIVPEPNAAGVYLDDQYLWQDRNSGLYILYISDELREKMPGSDDSEMARGKLARDLRRKFLYFAANPVVRARHLLIYSDDADKASGNGWFDGNYAGLEIRFREKFQAALEWISAHSWIEAVTSADLDPAKDCIGTIDMKDATCPSVDPGGAATIDTYGKEIHFDAWYDNWKSFPSYWLGRNMEEISQGVEYAILDWPAAWRNSLYELAQMYFSMFLHESQWNKQPLESIGGLNANQRSDVIEPEDFVISATLQIRTAQVYLNAAAWAEWALATNDIAVYVNNGPVIARLQGLRHQSTPGRPAMWMGTDILPDPLRWDRDILQTVVLYNREVLVVMDRNGGRVTHLFAVMGGEPVCLSGTFKCFQWLTGEKKSGESVGCDGEVIQNTVSTPNHAYLACDVKQSDGVIGRKFNPKTTVNVELDCYYPDNFNAYDLGAIGTDSVEWHYVQTGPPPGDMNLALFRNLLAVDRTDKLAGRPGVVFHSDPDFRKRLTLQGRKLNVEYFSVQPGHVTANELCADLRRCVAQGQRNRRRKISPSRIEIYGGSASFVAVELGTNCTFTVETLEGEANRRLHRAITDCIEITSPAGGDFSYRIEIM